jgi:hypothetical protein
MISARPPERRSTVENSWKTRIGSSELRTVTALVRRMRFVLAPRRRGRRRGRDGEVGPVVLAHPEDVQTDLVGELDLLHEVAQALLAPISPCRVSANVKTPISTTAFYRSG